MESWSPFHIYLKEGVKAGGSREELSKAYRVARRLYSRGLPPILTLAQLARETGVRFRFLKWVVEATPMSSNQFYKSFSISKRNGGKRLILVPTERLKVVQKWISDRILSQAPVHKASYAFHPGSSIVECARQHCGSRWLIRLDIENFFESIKEHSTYEVFRNLGFAKLLSYELARICTTRMAVDWPPSRVLERNSTEQYSIGDYDFQFLGFLPQGAPTSPMLSNLVCADLDQELDEYCSARELVYTRYADDMVFSSSLADFSIEDARGIVALVENALRCRYFKLNMEKVRVSPPGSRKLVLGLVVNSETPTLRRRFKDQLRQHLYYIKKLGPTVHAANRKFDSVDGLRKVLKGKIDFACQVQPHLGLGFLEQFTRIDWPVREEDDGAVHY